VIKRGELELVKDPNKVRTINYHSILFEEINPLSANSGMHDMKTRSCTFMSGSETTSE